MSRRKYWLIIDTETTEESTVADFGALICDRHGKVYSRCAVLVAGEFGEKKLFHNRDAGIWGLAGLKKRTDEYHAMLNDGRRTLASVAAINRWLENVRGHYNPELTAYNLPFDVDKTKNTGIGLDVFPERFDLWQAALGCITTTRAYKQHCLDHHLFNNRTEPLGNMTYQTKAETVYHYLSGDDTPEPHTAAEDAEQFEKPVLVAVLKTRNFREKMRSYNWRDHQLRDNYRAK